MPGAVVLLLCLVAAAAGAERWIGPDGDDTADGSAARPLRTFAVALGRLQPGDTLHVRDGLWREGGLTLRLGGTAEAPITIAAAPGAAPVISALRPVTGWTRVADGVFRAPWPHPSQQLFVDGGRLQQIGVACPWHTTALTDSKPCLPPVGSGRDDLRDRSFWYDTAERALWCRLDGEDPAQRLVEASVDPFVLDGGAASHVVLRGLTLRGGDETGRGGQHGVLRIGGRGWTVEDCAVLDGDFAGISMSGEDHVVRGCRLAGNGAIGLQINGSDAAHRYGRWPDRPPQRITLERLVITGNNARGFYWPWHAGGIKCIPSCRDVTVRGCRVEDNAGPGIWFDSCLGGIAIAENVVRGNEVGIFYEISGPAAGDAVGARIRGNTVERNRHQGIYLAACRGAEVVDNACAGNRWDIVVHGMPRRDGSGAYALADNRVSGNRLDGVDADLVLYTGQGAHGNRIEDNRFLRGDDVGGRVLISDGAGYGGRRLSATQALRALGVALSDDPVRSP